jgi:hypothetical protein
MKVQTGQKEVKKGFWARLIDKLDKKMQEKAKAESCCGGAGKAEKRSCCS